MNDYFQSIIGSRSIQIITSCFFLNNVVWIRLRLKLLLHICEILAEVAFAFRYCLNKTCGCFSDASGTARHLHFRIHKTQFCQNTSTRIQAFPSGQHAWKPLPAKLCSFKAAVYQFNLSAHKIVHSVTDIKSGIIILSSLRCGSLALWNIQCNGFAAVARALPKQVADDSGFFIRFMQIFWKHPHRLRVFCQPVYVAFGR